MNEIPMSACGKFVCLFATDSTEAGACRSEDANTQGVFEDFWSLAAPCFTVHRLQGRNCVLVTRARLSADPLEDPIG